MMPYRPHLVLREEGLFVREDRLPNFRDGRLDFLRTDGKEAVNGFPSRNSGEEEDADFQQKKTDGLDETIGCPDEFPILKMSCFETHKKEE